MVKKTLAKKASKPNAAKCVVKQRAKKPLSAVKPVAKKQSLSSTKSRKKRAVRSKPSAGLPVRQNVLSNSEITNLRGDIVELKHEDEEINQKLDVILKEQSKLFGMDRELRKSEQKIIDMEEAELVVEQRIEKDEINEEEELKKLVALELQIKERVGPHPLVKITYKDITKGAIGAFVGIVGHFAFLEGFHVAEKMSLMRATVLYLVAMLIGFAFLYFSGFRKVKQVKVLHFIPVRLFVIYFTAVCVVALVFWIFGQFSVHTSFSEVYRSISAVMILAILGAATADLIGDKE